jgi:histidyl-tRNA synthetase
LSSDGLFAKKLVKGLDYYSRAIFGQVREESPQYGNLTLLNMRLVAFREHGTKKMRVQGAI